MKEQSGLMLAQTSSSEDADEGPQDEEFVQLEVKSKSSASIKAPSDKNKLKLVQINEQEPPRKKIGPPRQILVQIDEKNTNSEKQGEKQKVELK